MCMTSFHENSDIGHARLLHCELNLSLSVDLLYNTIHMYSGIASGRVLDGELLYAPLIGPKQYAPLIGGKSL